MAFTKVLKTASYYRRFQVKPRRRREGKTDYQARRNMIRQDKRKYNCVKFRLVVRFTNKKVICQIVYATIQGDRVICSAESTELARYGMPVGLTNYAAAYATGLLCARRCLKQLKLDEMYQGVVEADGEDFHIEENMEDEDQRRPFKCVLDIGLVRTTTGHRVFGALKGAVDGGLHIPHSSRRFPGAVRGEEGADDTYDAEAHRRRIFACHVADYMNLLKEEDPEAYEQRFSRYIKADITGDNLPEKIKELHAAIRANPDRAPKVEKPIIKAVREGDYIKTVAKDGTAIKYLRPLKLTAQQRKKRVEQKVLKIVQAAEAADEE